MPRPRWILQLQASFFRALMSIGMFLHRRASPTPPNPTLTRTIDSTISPQKGRIKLHFYTPKDYNSYVKRRKQYKKHGRRISSDSRTWPVVINFHGGGFTLGSATDDARWAAYVLSQVGAVVVSVDYRLAPRYPFPTAVEDGADAIMYLAEHASSLHLDVDRFAISGFSSGGNMCFTVPLRLQECLLYRAVTTGTTATLEPGTDTDDLQAQDSGIELSPSSHLRLPFSDGDPRMESTASLASLNSKSPADVSETPVPDLNIRGIVSFYPPVDYTQTRVQRRATCARTDQQLPALFTNLFDDSYLSPPTINLSNPYLSPGKATDEMLVTLPDDIVILTAEWDMLVVEAEMLRDRLAGTGEEGSTGLGKRVKYWKVPGVPHGWDKAPNPFRETPGTKEWYGKACDELQKILA